jgi:hypothetical protein
LIEHHKVNGGIKITAARQLGDALPRIIKAHVRTVKCGCVFVGFEPTAPRTPNTPRSRVLASSTNRFSEFICACLPAAA